VDWKPERAVQAKSGIFKTKKTKKQSYDCWNTLRGEYIAPVQEMVTSSKISRSRVDFLPSKSTSYYYALSLPYQMAWPCPQECHIQWRLSSVMLRNHSPLQTYMFCLIPSSHLSHTVIRSFKSHSYSHTFMHLHINTSMNSHIHAYTQNINSHMIASVAQSLVWSYLINSAINCSKC